MSLLVPLLEFNPKLVAILRVGSPGKIGTAVLGGDHLDHLRLRRRQRCDQDHPDGRPGRPRRRSATNQDPRGSEFGRTYGGYNLVSRSYATIQKQKGHLDIVFSNAGGESFAPLGTITEHFEQIFNINVNGLLFTVQKFQKALPLLKNGGAIILNASIVASSKAVRRVASRSSCGRAELLVHSR
jgi:hypothetical protein